MDLDAWSACLRVLADPTRVRLLALLESEELTVAELSAITRLAQPRVSTHLAKLKEAGLARDRRAGVSAYYRFDALTLEPGEQRLKSIEELKWKVELAQAIGADRLVTPSAGTGNYTLDDYKRGVDNMREAAEIAKPFGITLMLEFARTSRFAGSLPTALKLVRETNHPNYRVMMDTYHFWGGISKFEDLELLRDGELHHLHFEDVPADPPRELQGQPDRKFPGEGIAPLRRIIEVLKAKKYAGAVSFETFNPEVQSTDPSQVAMRVRKAIEPLIG